nr:glutamic acid-rich protein-like [Tanacetum cinerariifolium]
SHQWKYLIHTIMQCLSPKSTGFNEFSRNIVTALVCLATNRTYNFSKMIFDGMVKNINNKNVSKGEGSGTPTEHHHTPFPEAETSYPTTSSILPPSIPTAPIPPNKNDSEEIARVLTSIDAATVLAGGIDVPTGSGSIPTAGPPATIISTGSEVGPTASLIVTKRKGKEVMVGSDTPKKKKLQE